MNLISNATITRHASKQATGDTWRHSAKVSVRSSRCSRGEAIKPPAGDNTTAFEGAKELERIHWRDSKKKKQRRGMGMGGSDVRDGSTRKGVAAKRSCPAA
ncbi:hypothetical protein NL676_022194 [Syzygium grande]|nr:hypothetical protein NL676_022194 [Syzygium grande]